MTDGEARQVSAELQIEELRQRFEELVGLYEEDGQGLDKRSDVEDQQIDQAFQAVIRAAAAAVGVTAAVGPLNVDPARDWRMVFEPNSNVRVIDIEDAFAEVLGRPDGLAREEASAASAALPLPERLINALVDCLPSEETESSDLEAVLWEHAVEPANLSSTNDRRRVREALNLLVGAEARALAQDVVGVLEARGFFSADAETGGRLVRLQNAFEAADGSLSDWGRVMWAVEQPSGELMQTTSGRTRVSATGSATWLSKLLSKEPDEEKLGLLEQVLRSVPVAARPLTHDRRSGHEVLHVDDEYDWQDLVNYALRLVFPDVIAENPSGRSGESSTRIDFFVPSLHALVELKYARRGTDGGKSNGKAISKQVHEDVTYYGSEKNYPKVRHIFFVVYDEGLVMENPEDLIKEIQATRPANGARARVLHVAVPAGSTKTPSAPTSV